MYSLLFALFEEAPEVLHLGRAVLLVSLDVRQHVVHPVGLVIVLGTSVGLSLGRSGLRFRLGIIF